MKTLEDLPAEVVDAAFHLHKDLGPGLLESVYEVVLAKLLRERGLRVERQKPIAIEYAGLRFDEGFRADLIVEDRLLVELKSIESLLPVHGKQVLTYLRLLDLPLGLLINFGAPTFKKGIKRVVNNHTDFAPSRASEADRMNSREAAKNAKTTEYVVKPIVTNTELVAYCGLYCGACGAYRKARCPGCHENRKAGWCKVRTCCIDQAWASCAECDKHGDVRQCRWYNNLIARLFGFIFRSDRRACVLRIKEIGLEPFAKEMAEKGAQTIRR
jgi:iron complex transport system substrate-binding protein